MTETPMRKEYVMRKKMGDLQIGDVFWHKMPIGRDRSLFLVAKEVGPKTRILDIDCVLLDRLKFVGLAGPEKNLICPRESFPCSGDEVKIFEIVGDEEEVVYNMQITIDRMRAFIKEMEQRMGDLQWGLSHMCKHIETVRSMTCVEKDSKCSCCGEETCESRAGMKG
jgi:hypothetical protein